jgi:uncharacterized membrane protein YagU involved in acid resistance
MTAASLPFGQPRALKAIFWAGLVAGVFDIIFAFVMWAMRGRGMTWVLQSVAGGLLGRETFNKGAGSAALGLILHFFIALVWAAVFFLASRKLALLTSHPIVCGLFYGAIIYLVMYFIVLPNSAYHSKLPDELQSIVTNLLGHMILIGLPISLLIRRFSQA